MGKQVWTCALSGALGVVGVGPVAMAHEGDIGVAVINGRIAVGLVQSDPVTFQEWVVPGQRVFGAELDGSGFAAEPGLFGSNLSVGGAQTFPTGGQIGFTITAPLTQWSGSGFEATTAQMRVEFASGAQSVTTPIVGSADGFLISTGPTGSFDEHHDFFLTGDEGVPATGVYLLRLTLWGQSASASVIDASDEVFLVFNFGADEEDHEAAIGWAEANLVPTPATAAMFSLLFGAGMRRRR